MTMLTIREPIQADALDLATHLRSEDRKEVAALYGEVDVDQLAKVIEEGMSWSQDVRAVVTPEGRFVCLFGVTPLPGKRGGVWLLGTDELDRHIYRLCREARRYIAAWKMRYSTITNMTSASNTRVIAWLRWLGFRFSDTHILVGPDNVPFIQFEQ